MHDNPGFVFISGRDANMIFMKIGIAGEASMEMLIDSHRFFLAI